MHRRPTEEREWNLSVGSNVAFLTAYLGLYVLVFSCNVK